MTEIKGKIKLGNISIGEGKIHRAGIRKKIKIRKYKAWRKEYTYCIAGSRRKIQIRKYKYWRRENTQGWDFSHRFSE